MHKKSKCPLFNCVMSESINGHCEHRWISQLNFQEVNCIFVAATLKAHMKTGWN